MENLLQPTHFPPGEGKSYRLGRMTMIFKTTANQGWNAYRVCEPSSPRSQVCRLSPTHHVSRDLHHLRRAI